MVKCGCFIFMWFYIIGDAQSRNKARQAGSSVVTVLGGVLCLNQQLKYYSQWGSETELHLQQIKGHNYISHHKNVAWLIVKMPSAASKRNKKRREEQQQNPSQKAHPTPSDDAAATSADTSLSRRESEATALSSPVGIAPPHLRTNKVFPGSGGTPCKLTVNHVRMKLPKGKIYQYNLKI